MATIRQGFMISEIFDKMGVEISKPDGTAEQIGSDLIIQIVSKAHKAQKEIIALVAAMYGISKLEANDVDLVDFINELSKDMGFENFFGQAVK